MSFSRFAPASWRRWADHALEERDRPRDRRETALLGAAALFVLLNAAALVASDSDFDDWQRFWPFAVWLAATLAAHWFIRHLKPHRDPFLLPVFALLGGWGLLLQARLAPNFLGRQTLWYALATVALVAIATAPRSLQALLR